jgi:hypothetical protein
VNLDDHGETVNRRMTSDAVCAALPVACTERPF